jgi:hypothetical protein
MKSTITPLAIHIMRMFSFSSSSWLVIDPSFFGSLAPVPFSTERGHYLPLILQPAYAGDGLRVRKGSAARGALNTAFEQAGDPDT